MAFATGTIAINGGNTTDPKPAVITTDDPDSPIYLAKESANTWGVYVPKNGSEQAAVFDVVQYRIGGISWNFANVHVASLPSGYIKARWEYLNAMCPVGHVEATVYNVNPGTRIGGTWVQFGQGRCLVGVGTGNDGSTSMTFTSLGTGGEYKHKLTITEMPAHSHEQNVSSGHTGSAIRNDYREDGRGLVYPQGLQTSQTGGSQSHNNIQPYIGVYLWRRTA